MRKILLIITLCILYVGNLTAQNTTMDYLTNNKWETLLPADQSFSIITEFSKAEEVNSLIYKGTTSKLSYLYYLSNEIEESFDNDKVGMREDGKYIIERNLENGDVYRREIIEINDQKLVLKNLHNNTLSEYKAIKKE